MGSCGCGMHDRKKYARQLQLAQLNYSAAIESEIITAKNNQQLKGAQ